MGRTLKRRRLESKTDYRTRLSLLLSGKARIVIRKTNRFIIAQIVISKEAQDSVVCGALSKDLLLSGWPKENIGSLKSLPACYLTGVLVGNMAKKKGVTEAIVDIGMNRNIGKSRLYAVVKGAVDSGLKIPHSEDALPTMDEISKNPKIGKLINIKEKLK